MRLSRRGKRRLIVLVALVGLMGVTVVGFKQVRGAQQRRLVAQAREAGLQAHAEGDLAGTLKQLNYVVQHDKNDLDVILAFADARLRTPLADGRHMQEALGYYKHAISLIEQDPEIGTDDPAYGDALHRMLDLYTALGLRFELIHVANQVLELEPDDVGALSAKARALFTDRLFEDSLLIVDRLVRLEPQQLQWRQFKLEILNQLGELNQAMLEQCDLWESEHGGDGRYLLLKSGLLAHMGRMEEARQHAVAAADRGADDLEVLQLLISLLDAVGERELASSVVASARTKFPDEQWVHEATIRRHWQASRFSAALDELAVVEREFAEMDPSILRLETLLLIATERLDEAESTLQQLRASSAATDADVAWATALESRLRLDGADWRAALKDVQQALVLNPKDPAIHYLSGEIHARIGETGRALDFYRDAHSLDRDWIAAGVAYGELLLTTGRIEDAYDVARSLVRRASGGQPSVYMFFARTYLALRRTGGTMVLANSATGDPIEISAILDAVYQVMPDDPEVAALLIESQVDEGRIDRAQRTVDAIVADQRVTAPVLLGLAEVSRRLGLGLEQRLIDRASELGADDVALAFGRAEIMADAGDAAGGLALIDEALGRAAPERRASSATQVRRAAYLLRVGDPRGAAALRALSDAFEQTPTVQSFVLSESVAWTDRQLVTDTIERLRAILGDSSQQVHLAEANFLLRFEAGDEAQLARSIVLINKVLEQSPESLPALMLSARASLLGDHPAPQRAIEHLGKAISVYPHEVSLYAQLIHLLQESGDFERAERYLYRLGQISDDRPEMRRAELHLLQAQGDYEMAMIRAAALIDESAPESDQLLLAAMQLQAGDHEAAERTYRRLLAEGPPTEFLLTQAADFYALTGRFEDGVALLEHAEPEGGAAMREVLLGTYHQRHGAMERAEAHLKRAVALDPKLATASHQLARFFLARSDHKSARIEAIRGLQLDADHVGLRATLAIAELGLGPEGRDEAIALLESLGGENDHLVATLRLLQDVPFGADGGLSPAPKNLAAARALVDEHGQFMPCWLLAISLHVEADRLNDAIDLARSAIGRLPTQPEPAEWATSLLVEARRYEEALTEAHEWRRRSLASPLVADLMIASILLELGRTSDAVAQIDRYADQIVAERHRAPDHLALWLEVLVRAGEQQRAAALAQQVLGEDARWRTLWTSLAVHMTDADAYEALGAVEAQVATPAELLPLAVAWSELASRSGRTEIFDRAEQLARQVEQSPGAGSSARIVLGAIAEERGDVETAKQLYRQVVDEDGRNALALNNLAYALAKHDGDAAAALPYVERALQVMPDQPNILDTYGYVLMGLGRLDDAEAALRLALDQRPDDIGLRIRMVELLVQAERVEEATVALRRVELDLAVEPVTRRRYEERLQALDRALQRHSAAVGS